MRDFLILLVHFVATIVKLVKLGGVRAVMAESLVLKHQLVVLNRSRKRAPHLNAWDRILLGITTLLVSPRRIRKLGAVVKTATLFKFHEALKKRKYRLFFSSCTQRRPGPKGPAKAGSAEESPKMTNLERRLNYPLFFIGRYSINNAGKKAIDVVAMAAMLEKHLKQAFWTA